MSSSGGLLDVEPLVLQFPFVLNKQTSCPVMLSNKTNNNIAFKALTTDQMKYCVRPNMGIILPHATRKILVTMQAPKEIPLDMQCKDKFKFQSLVVEPGVTSEDITANMFKKESGHHVEEYKLTTVYVFPPQVSSPVAQGSEGSSFSASEMNDVNLNVPEVAKTLLNTHDKSSEGKMDTGNLLKVEPSELTFPFELKKQISCSVQLSNITDKHVAFKVKTTHPKKYSARPNMGIIMPRSRCDVTVIMQTQEEAPPDMKCKDKFVIQSVVVSPQSTINDINRDMFNGTIGVVKVSKLKVVYVSSPQSSNLVASTSEGGSSARTSMASERNLDGPDQELLRSEEFVRQSSAWLVFGITIGLLIVIFWYLMKMTFSFIWSFVIVVMVKMVTRIVSDSLEDWVVKAFIYVIFQFLFRCKNREHVPG